MQVRFLILLSFSLLLFSCSYQPVKQDTDPPEVKARVDFNRHTEGETYGNADVKRDFGSLKSWGTYWPFQRAQIIQDKDPARDKVLMVKYPHRQVRSLRSGASWFWKPIEPTYEAFLSYWVYFPDTLEFRAGGKLHGLVGGKANTGGNKPTGTDGWSCRMHWGPEDQIKLYVYHKDQISKWGDVYYFQHNPKPHDVSAGVMPKVDKEDYIHLTKGEWHHISVRVVVNNIGAKNGIAQAWYDGKLVVDLRGFEFRASTVPTDKLLIDGAYFSTFYGGRDERYMPVKDEVILFDDFVLSETQICPEGLECDFIPE